MLAQSKGIMIAVNSVLIRGKYALHNIINK